MLPQSPQAPAWVRNRVSLGESEHRKGVSTSKEAKGTEASFSRHDKSKHVPLCSYSSSVSALRRPRIAIRTRERRCRERSGEQVSLTTLKRLINKRITSRSGSVSLSRACCCQHALLSVGNRAVEECLSSVDFGAFCRVGEAVASFGVGSTRNACSSSRSVTLWKGQASALGQHRFVAAVSRSRTRVQHEME